MITNAEFGGHFAGLARCADAWSLPFLTPAEQLGAAVDRDGIAKRCLEEFRARVDMIAEMLAEPTKALSPQLERPS